MNKKPLQPSKYIWITNCNKKQIVYQDLQNILPKKKKQKDLLA